MVLGSVFCRSVHQSLTQVIRKCTNAESGKAKILQGLKNELRDTFQMPVNGQKFLVKIQSPQMDHLPDFIHSTTIVQDAGVPTCLPHMNWIYWDMDSSSSQIHLLARYVDDCIKQSPQGLPAIVIIKANNSDSVTKKDQLLIFEKHINGSVPIVFFDENQMKYINLNPDTIEWKKHLVEKLIFATLSHALVENLLSEIHTQVSNEATLAMDIMAIRQLFRNEFND
jgi:hypothetical protein